MSDISINSLGIAVGVQDQRSEWILQAGRLDHDWFTLEILQSFISSGNIIDIGANIGTHTIFYEKLASFSGSSVYAFEANSTSFQCLAHNCKKAIKIPIALGDSASLLNLHPNKNLGSVYVSRDELKIENRILDHYARERLVVPCERLDSFLIDNVSYIKIDVEGFEEYVLAGAQKTIMKSRPMIWIEISPGHLSRANSSVENLLRQFENMRYFPVFCKGSPLQCDVMMAPSELAHLCMQKVSKTQHVVSLVRQEELEIVTAYSNLRVFLQK